MGGLNNLEEKCRRRHVRRGAPIAMNKGIPAGSTLGVVAVPES